MKYFNKDGFLFKESKQGRKQFASYPNSKVPPICGVYGLYDSLFDKWYIGSSKDVTQRVQGHISKINRKDKTSRKTYRFQEFHLLHENDYWITPHLLEICNVADLKIRECFYIDKFDSINKGHNKNYP